MKKKEKSKSPQVELEELKHKQKMEQLEYFRGTEKLRHLWELERIRIKTAEVRRHTERKFRLEKGVGL